MPTYSLGVTRSKFAVVVSIRAEPVLTARLMHHSEWWRCQRCHVQEVLISPRLRERWVGLR